MAEDAPSIAIIAGEASGDLYGAHLAARLKQRLPSIRITGIGGRKMRHAGVELIEDSTSWSAIGIAEAVKVGPRLLLIFHKLKALFKADPPDLVVLIDFGAFNVPVGRFLHSIGVKVLYFVPPSSWNRHTSNKRLKGLADRIVTPFPWSAELLEKQGFAADFFGHPLLDVVKSVMSRDEFCALIGLDASKPIIALLPGSRSQEIANILPVLLIAAARLREEMPDLQFAIPPAQTVNAIELAEVLNGVPWVDAQLHSRGTSDPSGRSTRVSPAYLNSQLRSLEREDGFQALSSKLRISLAPGMTYEVLAHSRAAVVTSGTATVEAAILDCPMVIVYRGGLLTNLEFMLRGGKKPLFIGMPNIILNRPACPELVSGEATPKRIADLMLGLIPDSPVRTEMIQALGEVREVLGQPGAIEKTAGVVLGELRNADCGMGSDEERCR